MNRNRTIVASMALAVWIALAASASAQELRVSARVLSVEPILAEPGLICDVKAPARETGLAAALRWDLRGRCRESGTPPEVRGYAVVYQWDGRRFTTVTAEPPKDDRLALRIQIN